MMVMSAVIRVILLATTILSDLDDWNLVWSDEFTGTTLDTDVKWNNYRPTYTNSQQLQQYVPDYAYLDGEGHLVIKTKYEPEDIIDPHYNVNMHYEYKSGVVTTKGKYPFGPDHKVEIKAKLPDPAYGRLHLAFWLQKESGSCYQEYDIMEQWTGKENYGVYNRVYGAYHFNTNNDPQCGIGVSEEPSSNSKYPYSTKLNQPTNPNYPFACRDGCWIPDGLSQPLCDSNNNPNPAGNYYCGTRDWSSSYSIWRLEWETDHVSLFINDFQVGYFDAYGPTSDGSDPDPSNIIHTIPYQDMHLIINAAVCGKISCNGYGEKITDGTQEAKMYIDYVRIYKKVYTPTPVITPAADTNSFNFEPDNVDNDFNNYNDGLTMTQVLEMNVFISAIVCLLIIALCTTCYYAFIKCAPKEKGKYNFVENEEDQVIVDRK